MGLLDSLNSADGIFALSLLDAAAPKAQRTSFGGGLLQALGNAQQYKSAEEEKRRRAEMQALQMQQMQQAIAQNQRQQQMQDEQIARGKTDEGIMRQWFAPQAGPMPDGGNIPQAQVNPREMLGQGMSMGGLDQALKLNQMLNPAGKSPADMLNKIDPKDYTPESFQAFMQSGNPAALRAAPKEHVPPGDWLLYNLSGAKAKGIEFDQWDQARRRAGAASTTVTLGSPVPVTLGDGTQALVQPANRPGEPPQIMRIPGTGEIIRPPAKEMPASMAEKFAQNSVTIGKIQNALSDLAKMPDALGAKNYLPDAVMQRLDADGVKVRAQIADIAGQKIHDRSGAAVTVGESERLKPYVPAATDTAPVAKQKLEMFLREYQAMQRALASGASIAQAARASSQPQGQQSLLDQADAILKGGR